MAEKIEQILEQLKNLTLLEASELVTRIEETFGVDTSVNVGPSLVTSTAASTEESEQKTEFNIILESIAPDKKIAVLKIVRTLTGLGLKEAKELVESAPKQIQEGVAKDTAEDIKKQLEDAGGKVTLA